MLQYRKCRGLSPRQRRRTTIKYSDRGTHKALDSSMAKLRSTSLGRAGSIETILLKFGGSNVYSGGQDLIMVRSLADTDNRGKLNLAEFHIAMGLIYRSEYLFQSHRCDVHHPSRT